MYGIGLTIQPSLLLNILSRIMVLQNFLATIMV